jgi:hypothetical protein
MTPGRDTSVIGVPAAEKSLMVRSPTKVCDIPIMTDTLATKSPPPPPDGTAMVLHSMLPCVPL